MVAVKVLQVATVEGVEYYSIYCYCSNSNCISGGSRSSTSTSHSGTKIIKALISPVGAVTAEVLYIVATCSTCGGVEHVAV